MWSATSSCHWGAACRHRSTSMLAWRQAVQRSIPWTSLSLNARALPSGKWCKSMHQFSHDNCSRKEQLPSWAVRWFSWTICIKSITRARVHATYHFFRWLILSYFADLVCRYPVVYPESELGAVSLRAGKIGNRNDDLGGEQRSNRIITYWFASSEQPTPICGLKKQRKIRSWPANCYTAS